MDRLLIFQQNEINRSLEATARLLAFALAQPGLLLEKRASRLSMSCLSSLLRSCQMPLTLLGMNLPISTSLYSDTSVSWLCCHGTDTKVKDLDKHSRDLYLGGLGPRGDEKNILERVRVRVIYFSSFNFDFFKS